MVRERSQAQLATDIEVGNGERYDEARLFACIHAAERIMSNLAGASLRGLTTQIFSANIGKSRVVIDTLFSSIGAAYPRLGGLCRFKQLSFFRDVVYAPR